MGCLGSIVLSILEIICWALKLVGKIILFIVSILAWILGWLSWAVFKILYLILLILCLFCASPPSPATIDAADAVDGSGSVKWDVLIQAAEAGDVGAQFLLAKKSQEYAERDDLKTTLASVLTGLPEHFLREDADLKDKFGRQAEFWYGKVADQGYMLARYEEWWMILARWERNIELWCWYGENSKKILEDQ